MVSCTQGLLEGVHSQLECAIRIQTPKAQIDALAEVSEQNFDDSSAHPAPLVATKLIRFFPSNRSARYHTLSSAPLVSTHSGFASITATRSWQRRQKQ